MGAVAWPFHDASLVVKSSARDRAGNSDSTPQLRLETKGPRRIAAASTKAPSQVHYARAATLHELARARDERRAVEDAYEDAYVDACVRAAGAEQSVASTPRLELLSSPAAPRS